MTKANVFPSFAAAYQGGLATLLAGGRETERITDATSIGSGFGARPRATQEITGFSMHVTDPRNFLIQGPHRRLRVFQAIGMWTWTIAGSNTLEDIVYYNRRADALSDDGLSLAGAFGSRLASGLDTQSQLAAAIRRLRADPASRRAVATILLPADALSPSRDMPCAIAVQYLIRDGRLEAITYMRSQSAAMVLVYDIFIFASLQHWVAAALGIDAGAHHLMAGSYHVYEDEIALSRRIVDGPVIGISMSRMNGSSKATADLLSFERSAREASSSQNVSKLREIIANLAQPDSFELEAAVILGAFGLARVGHVNEARSVLYNLSSPLRQAALADWEERPQ